MSKLRGLNKVGALVGALFVTASIFAISGQAIANHEPANKVSAAGSSTELVPATEPVGTVILSEQVKTSTPSDLILGVTAECSITTDVTTVGTDTQGAEGTLKFWVEVDGVPVPVAQDDPDAGRVVFCNRLYERTTQFADQDAMIKTFLRTRNANGFNWMALNVGHGVHTIEVKAQLTTDATARASATGVIGNRTLIVEPVKSANDEVVTEL